MFLVSLKKPITIFHNNAYIKVMLIVTNKTPNTGLTIVTLYSASGGDDSKAIEDFTDIGTIVISLDNLAGYVERKE